MADARLSAVWLECDSAECDLAWVRFGRVGYGYVQSIISIQLYVAQAPDYRFSLIGNRVRDSLLLEGEEG